MCELKVTGNNLMSVGDMEDEDEVVECCAEAEEEEESYLCKIAADLASNLTANESKELAAACLPGAQALSKVHVSVEPCIC